MLLEVVLLLALHAGVSCQACQDREGKSVQWWVILKVPPRVGSYAYGYIDSNSLGPAFTVLDERVELGRTALTNTLELINSGQLETVAWNDEHPNNKTSSSAAHSKGVIAYDGAKQRGYFLLHSLPKYPAFASNRVSPAIEPGQNYNGQHLVCFSLAVAELDGLAQLLLYTQPYVYQANVKPTSANPSLVKLAAGSFPASTTLFWKKELASALGYSLRAIFKSNKRNGSLFEDGLTAYLGGSVLVAQSWGNPIEKSWCQGGFQVLNTVSLRLGGVRWAQSQDHSKWVSVGSSYACFGDMNREPTQWVRGGAFYCFHDPRVVAALQSVIVSHDSCAANLLSSPAADS